MCGPNHGSQCHQSWVVPEPWKESPGVGLEGLGGCQVGR